jgi:hypothetical protein
MNAKRLLSISAIALLAVFNAHAEGGDNSQHGYDFVSTRSAAEVRAEARNPIHVSEASVGTPDKQMSNVQRASVRAEAIMALRAGQISRGEIGLL